MAVLAIILFGRGLLAAVGDWLELPRTHACLAQTRQSPLHVSRGQFDVGCEEDREGSLLLEEAETGATDNR